MVGRRCSECGKSLERESERRILAGRRMLTWTAKTIRAARDRATGEERAFLDALLEERAKNARSRSQYGQRPRRRRVQGQVRGVASREPDGVAQREMGGHPDDPQQDALPSGGTSKRVFEFPNLLPTP